MNQKLTLSPVVDSSDDVAVPSDDAVRQALLRMGSGKQRAGGSAQHERQSGSQHGYSHGGGQRRGGEQMQAAASSPDARRRRFSQNEHVPVEYVSRDRPSRSGEAMRLDAARIDALEPADDRSGFLERELERERQARAAAERAAEEAKAALNAARTRIGHLEIDLQEVRAQRQAMIDLAQSAAQQSAFQAAAQQAAANQQALDARPASVFPAAADAEDGFMPPASRRGRGRPRRAVSPVDADAGSEPEPVKWWSDD